MKHIIAVFCAAIALSGIAANEEFLKETGGYIIKSDPNNGLVLIANAQKRLPEDMISKPVSYMRFHAKMSIGIKAVDEAKSIAPDSNSAKSLGATIVVFVNDDAKSKSPILVSPDEHWAVVNISALNADEPGAEILALRTRKAVNRAICLVCGAGGSQYPNTLVGPFKNGIKDYDRFSNEGLPPDVFARMQHYLKTLGVRPIVRTTYANAVQQGWAPPPTNEFQKAVWNEVHAIPDNPIKIEFDPKKDK